MRALSASELLNVWERAFGQPPARRALVLLEASCDDSPEDLAQLSVGRRDARLLVLREQTLGPRLGSLACCPSCGERVELSFMASDLLTTPAPNVAEELAIEKDGYEVIFRLPNSLDLIAIAGADGLSAGRALLLDRCILRARCDGAGVTTRDLPAAVCDAVGAQMAEADPQADVRILMTCPACSTRWRSLFDIESFFWTEINAWATRMLREIHVLASAYGWCEGEILRLSAWRRQCYLNLAGG